MSTIGNKQPVSIKNFDVHSVGKKMLSANGGDATIKSNQNHTDQNESFYLKSVGRTDDDGSVHVTIENNTKPGHKCFYDGKGKKVRCRDGNDDHKFMLTPVPNTPGACLFKMFAYGGDGTGVWIAVDPRRKGDEHLRSSDKGGATAFEFAKCSNTHIKNHVDACKS